MKPLLAVLALAVLLSGCGAPAATDTAKANCMAYFQQVWEAEGDGLSDDAALEYAEKASEYCEAESVKDPELFNETWG